MVNKQSNKQTKLRRRGGRNQTRNQGIDVSRTFLLGSVPAGNGAFQFTAPLAVYPDEATLLPIARAYSEYKFTRMQVTLQPRCSTATQGSKWLGFGYSVPFTPGDYAQASALDSFRSSQAYGKESMTSLRPSNSSQRWYPVYQSDLTASQLADPNIVQAYLYIGTQSVQSGVVAADIHVSYTVRFRGPVSATQAIGPAAAVTVMRRFPIEGVSYEDDDLDPAGD